MRNPKLAHILVYILKEGSTRVLVSILNKEYRLGFPKVGRDSRFDLCGPSYGARKVDDFRQF